MPRLAVGGCSFSDRRYGIRPWGEQVAQHYNHTYIHEAASAGSNYRIWRTLTQHIINNRLTSGDTIVLQYTLVDRRESWTPVDHINTNPQEQIFEPYTTGSIIRLTPHSEQFAVGRQERALAHCHNYFTNHQYNVELFWCQHTAFAALCETRGITLRYLNTTYDAENRIPDIDGTHLLNEKDWCLDSAHMNQTGHDICARLVIDHLAPTIAAS